MEQIRLYELNIVFIATDMHLLRLIIITEHYDFCMSYTVKIYAHDEIDICLINLVSESSIVIETIIRRNITYNTLQYLKNI